MKNFSMPTFNFVFLATSAIFFTASSSLANEINKPEDFPVRPVNMIVPFGSGGGSDQFARAIAPAMAKIMETPIMVENKPGGSGRAAIPDFMSAPANGYTLLQFSDDVFSHYSAGRINENPTTDWTPIGIGNIEFAQVYIRSDDPRFSDWDTFVDYVKENPETSTIANISHAASLELISVNALTEGAGINLQQVSFDRPAERYSALVGGHVDSLFEQPGGVASLLEAGVIKPIVTMLNERPENFPDVPSLNDVDIDFEPMVRARGIFVRSETPEDRIEYLESVFNQAYQSEEFQRFLEQKNMLGNNNYLNREDSIELIDSMVESFRR